MTEDAFERARARIAEARAARYRDPELDAAVERAREALEALAQTTSELETAVPERLSAALREGMRSQVEPVARSLAEVRGLSAQTVRRLERLETTIDAERRARIEDLALLVDLISSGWLAVDRRLDRLERSLDRLDRRLDAAPAASVHAIGERRPGASA
jgi:hypothetical protein